jgi:inorganic pyrophosphatase
MVAKDSDYKNKLIEDIKSLSEDSLKTVADFAAYLKEREEWEATAEVLGNDELVQQIKESREAWAKGRKEEFISLEELKARLNV